MNCTQVNPQANILANSQANIHANPQANIQSNIDYSQDILKSPVPQSDLRILCPMCNKSYVKNYSINFEQKFTMCSDIKCPYPYGTKDFDLALFKEMTLEPKTRYRETNETLNMKTNNLNTNETLERKTNHNNTKRNATPIENHDSLVNDILKDLEKYLQSNDGVNTCQSDLNQQLFINNEQTDSSKLQRNEELDYTFLQDLFN